MVSPGAPYPFQHQVNWRYTLLRPLIQVGDLIDNFSLMTNPWVKVTLIAGAALIFVGFVRQFVR